MIRLLEQSSDQKLSMLPISPLNYRFGIQYIQINNQAGQETFQSITRSYYRGSIGVILVYDISSRDSFNNINKWLDQTRSYSNEKITMLLVGNKSDLDYKRAVTYD